MLLYDMLSCFVSSLLFTFSVNTTYEWRLANGNTEYEGRLELRIGNNEWATFDGVAVGSGFAPVVICRMFGYGLALSASSGLYGTGTGPFYAISLGCKEDHEKSQSLTECGRLPAGDSIFAYEVVKGIYAEDYGVRCLPGMWTTIIGLGMTFYLHHQRYFEIT